MIAVINNVVAGAGVALLVHGVAPASRSQLALRLGTAIGLEAAPDGEAGASCQREQGRAGRWRAAGSPLGRGAKVAVFMGSLESVDLSPED